MNKQDVDLYPIRLLAYSNIYHEEKSGIVEISNWLVCQQTRKRHRHIEKLRVYCARTKLNEFSIPQIFYFPFRVGVNNQTLRNFYFSITDSGF